MRDDLLHAQASVDWAVSHFPSFEQRMAAWLADNVHIRVEKTKPPITHSVIVGSQKALLPLSFNVDFGMYIHAIRSSLDMLATALAIRHSTCRPDDAYFPIASSADAFAAGRYKGHKLVERLPDVERAKIEALKPYNGGNKSLHALHQLDIMRKHRKLIDVEVTPGTMRLSGTQQALLNFVPVTLMPFRLNEEAVLGFLYNGAPEGNLQIAPNISIYDTDLPAGESIVGPLDDFARLANSIIGLFEG